MADYDTLIRGGTVIDGTMIPRFRADVGIKEGKVAKIGTRRGATADRVIDAWRQHRCTRVRRHHETSVDRLIGLDRIPEHLRVPQVLETEE